MPNELSVIDAGILSDAEKSDISRNIERIIAQHKDNRQEINRLVFESVAAMTEADDAQAELSGKGFFRRFIGGITGSNQKLQNKINSHRAAAQYASQQTLQKLAEQNLMTFDLITAVNNKLNASVNAINDELKNIYAGLAKFLKYNRNELARIEARLEHVERNVNLLTWQNSIEYQEFEGEEYSDMDDARKIVCLTRDFYDITKGNWTTSDLLLLKAAMSTIEIQPRGKVNYYGVLKQIESDKNLKDKLLDGAAIRPISDPSYLISMGTLAKLDALENKEAYVVDTVSDYLGAAGTPADAQDIRDNLTQKYLRSHANVNLDVEVESYDLILDLLYNLKQAEDEKLLSLSEGQQRALMREATDLYVHGKYHASLAPFQALAEADNARAMYFLGELYCNNLPEAEQNTSLGIEWQQRGAEMGDALCRLNLAYHRGLPAEERAVIIQGAMDDVRQLADAGDMFAAYELASCYDNGEGVEENSDEAKKWYVMAAQNGYVSELNRVGNICLEESNYQEANRWYLKAAENGYDWGWHNLANDYRDGKGVEKDESVAIEYYTKSYNMQDNAAGNSANRIGNIYWRLEKFEEANLWYQRSGEQGYDWGWNNLASSYKNGKGVPKDTEKALELYEKAYDMNGPAKGDSANSIGIIYSNEDEDRLSVEWYKKSAQAGYDWGWYNLGYKYRKGQGVKSNKQKAIECYQKAYDMHGGAAKDAAEKIADIYINDLHDFDEGKKWQDKCNEA